MHLIRLLIPVEPEQVYIPPVLRAPDDYIEPRIGPGYQAVIPDIIPLGKLVPQPLYKEPAVCLHAGAAQRSSRAAPALQQITNHLFTKVSLWPNLTLLISSIHIEIYTKQYNFHSSCFSDDFSTAKANLIFSFCCSSACFSLKAGKSFVVVV